MKKKYMAPTMEVVNVEMERLMDFASGNGELSINPSGPGTPTMQSKGHTFDIWGDDEDCD